ncbi:MAG: hypothetical protein LAO78_11675 [Acidobacteriia bacterium]|jgi:DNA-binding NarL/FixJ family response regulator|nr:hypothetical protein [Terriglobia bacterium]
MPERKIRILFGAMDPFSGEELRTMIEAQQDMEVIGSCASSVALLVGARELSPDAVILRLLENDRVPGIWSHLLEEYPKIILAALSNKNVVMIALPNIFNKPKNSSAMLITMIRLIMRSMQ